MPRSRLPRLKGGPEKITGSCRLKPSEKPWLAARKAMVRELRLVAESRKGLDLLKKQWKQAGLDPRRRGMISEQLSKKQAELKQNQVNYDKCKAAYQASKRRYHGHKNSLEEWIVGFEETQLRLRGARDESLSGSLLGESASGLVSSVAVQATQLETEFQTLWHEKNDLGIKQTVLIGWGRKLERMQQLIYELDAFIETQALEQSTLPSGSWGATFDSPKKLPPLSDSVSEASAPAATPTSTVVDWMIDSKAGTEDSSLGVGVEQDSSLGVGVEQPILKSDRAAEDDGAAAGDGVVGVAGGGGVGGGDDGVGSFAVEVVDGGDEAAAPAPGAEQQEEEEQPADAEAAVVVVTKHSAASSPARPKRDRRTRRLSQGDTELLMWCNTVDQVSGLQV
jgi:hypothetical protein